VQLIRNALYGQFDATAFVVVLVTLAVCFGFAVLGYDPQRGLVRRVQRPA
jgi:ABC-2 type transport system permease protein